MPKKLSVKKIIELDNACMSGRDIAIALSISRNSVAEVLNTAKVLGLSWKEIERKEENEIYRLLFPNKFNLTTEYGPIDYDYVHSELKSVGVTLKMLWNDYLITCKNNGTLPYSQYSYAEATLSMDEESWLLCHVNMFNYFGGTTSRLVCDNLKTGVIKHPKIGDIILNEAYEALGEHYSMAIMPTGVRKPKEKPSVEGTVGKLATAVIAKLRHNEYHSLYQLNKDILKAVNEFNSAPFQKRDGSRKSIFEELELPSLKPLPSRPFEIAKWSYTHKVGYNSHVVFEKNFYSAPYQYIGKLCDIKYTKSTIEIYFNNERIATHPRFASFIKNKYSTIDAHMPEKSTNPNWDVERIQNWAQKIGPNTLEVINRIINSVKIKEQSYNSALAVLKLSKLYTNERLENACEYALTQFSIPRYTHINSIFKINQYEEKNKNENNSSNTSSGYVRGSEYYGGKK